jgi:hippurate hydrolase
VNPIESAVVSVTTFHAGSTDNVIAGTAELGGTVRTLDASVRNLVEARMRTIIEATAATYGASAHFDFHRGYPVTVNHAPQSEFAARVAGEIVGPARVDAETPPRMGAEDFSYMLEARPGAFIFIGNGDSADLHNPGYDLNDEIIPIGCSYWARLVETAMPA